MQLNGIGSNHSSDMHNITNCLHDHKVTEKKGGASMSSQSQTASQQQISKQSLENNFSLTDWMKNVLDGARNIFGKIWGTQEMADIPVQNNGTDNPLGMGEEVLLTPMSEDANMLKDPGLSQASAAVQPVQNLVNNPYFSAIGDTGQKQQTVWQKVRVRFQNIAGYLTKHFSFSNRNAFHAKQEKSREDLSRRSRYRKDDLEIDCVLTDESYLLDSYNKKGEYSTLSANNSNEGTYNK